MQLIGIAGLAQNSYQWEWKIEGRALPIRGIIDNSGNAILVGTIGHPDSLNSRDAFILLAKPDGTYSYNTFVANKDTSISYLNVLQLPDNNYFSVGTKRPTTINSNTNQMVLIHIYDTNLNIISSKQFQLWNIYNAMDYYLFQYDKDSNIIMAASAQRKSGAPINLLDLTLIRFNQGGDTIETRFHHYERNVSVYDFKKIPDSENYLIIEFITQLYGDFECYVMKPDLTLKTVHFHSSFNYSIDEDITTDYWYPDKTFMMASTMSYLNDKSDRGLGVFRCDTLARISKYVFFNKIGIDDRNAFRQCMAFADVNSIYVVGWEDDLLNCANPDSIELYVVDTALNLVAYKALGGDKSYDVFGVLATKDGGALIFASAYYPEINCEPNVAVFYVSRNDLGLPPVKVLDLKYVDNSALVYPNPATDLVNIRVNKQMLQNDARIRLFNSAGKKVYDYKLPDTGNTIQLNIVNLPKGIYIYEIVQGEKLINKGKIIKK